MKRLILIIVTAFFLMISCAVMQPHKIKIVVDTEHGYSYEGMIDPRVVVETWIQMKGKTVWLGGLWFEMYYQNPDKDNRIKIVAIVRHQMGMVGAYTYIYDGKLYSFVRNDEGCFKLYPFTKEEKEIIKQRLLKVYDGATI